MSTANFDLLRDTLSLRQAANLITTIGRKRTVLLQGPMGSGKSSVLSNILEQLNRTRTTDTDTDTDADTDIPPTKYTAVYLDCNTKVDSGDLFMVQYGSEEYVDEADGGRKTRQTKTFLTVPHEELGLHLTTPIVLMIDELGKAHRSVKLAMLRLMLERKSAGYNLHPDSIVFATTNVATEGLGDLLQAHELDRIIPIQTRNPTNIEWMEDFAIGAGIDPSVMSWAKEHPELFHDFRMYDNAEGNAYIPHPRRPGGGKGVTPRGLHAVSDVLKERAYMDTQTLKHAMAGAIGQRGALDLAAYVTLADQLPSLDQLKHSPDTAPVPTSASAIMMVVYRSLQVIDRSWVKPWMAYMDRLPKEAAAVFVAGVRHERYNPAQRAAVMNIVEYQDWCVANGHMFAKDKK